MSNSPVFASDEEAEKFFKKQERRLTHCYYVFFALVTLNIISAIFRYRISEDAWFQILETQIGLITIPVFLVFYSPIGAVHYLLANFVLVVLMYLSTLLVTTIASIIMCFL